METSEHKCSEAPTEPAGETSPEFSPQPFRVRIGIVGPQSDARYPCGHRCRKLHIIFLPFSPNVVPAPVFSAALSRSFPFGKSWRSIPFSRSFRCQSANKKADTQRHQKSVRALLSLQNDVLCIGFEFQRRDCFSSVHLLRVPKSIKCGWRYFRIATVVVRRLLFSSRFFSYHLFSCSVTVKPSQIHCTERMFVCQGLFKIS